MGAAAESGVGIDVLVEVDVEMDLLAGETVEERAGFGAKVLSISISDSSSFSLLSFSRSPLLSTDISSFSASSCLGESGSLGPFEGIGRSISL